MRGGGILRLGPLWRRKRLPRRGWTPLPFWLCLHRRTLVHRRSPEQSQKRPLPPLEHVRLGSPFDMPTEEELYSVHQTLLDRAQNNILRVHPCWSTDDLKERPPPDRELGQDPNARYETVRGTVPAVLTKAMEIYGTFRDLEYYNGHYWTPLQHDGQLLPYRSQVLRIRVPEYFEDIQLADSDDEEGWGEEEEDMYRQYQEYTRTFAQRWSPRRAPLPSRRTTTMESVVRDLAERLSFQDYRRSPIRARTIVDRNQQALSTPTWVLQAAQENTTLRAQLLAHPGALQHIVTCLHEFDALWQRN
jgi:hypothetical protein